MFKINHVNVKETPWLYRSYFKVSNRDAITYTASLFWNTHWKSSSKLKAILLMKSSLFFLTTKHKSNISLEVMLMCLVIQCSLLTGKKLEFEMFYLCSILWIRILYPILSKLICSSIRYLINQDTDIFILIYVILNRNTIVSSYHSSTTWSLFVEGNFIYNVVFKIVYTFMCLSFSVFWHDFSYFVSIVWVN